MDGVKGNIERKSQMKMNKYNWKRILYSSLIVLIIVILFSGINCQIAYSWKRDLVKKEYDIKPIKNKDYKSYITYGNYGNYLHIYTENEYKNRQNTKGGIIQIIETSLKKCPFQIAHISNMKVPRVFPRTIKLKSGKVLIIGGNKGPKESAELFDPQTRAFKLITKNIYPKGYIVESKIYREPLLLPDGIVYYKGVVYNPETNTFSERQTPLLKRLFEFDTKPLTESEKVLQTFSDATALIGQGCKKDNICSEVYLFDPLKDKKYKPALLNLKKHFIQAIKLNKEEILILNNADKMYAQGTPRNKNGLELYDTENATCTILKDNVDIERILAIVKKCLLINTGTSSEIYGIGYQQNMFLFNLKTQQLSKLQAFSYEKRYKCLISNNYALFTGNRFIDIMDQSENQFSRLFDPNISYIGQTFTILDNGDVLVTGGKCIVDYVFYTEKNERSPFAAIISLKQSSI